jgi:hypothetical protein
VSGTPSQKASRPEIFESSHHVAVDKFKRGTINAPPFYNNMIYIIPGFGEDCRLLRYRKLTATLRSKGYKVKCYNPNWYKPLSDQVFCVGKNSIVIGFSFGAVLAYLIVKKYPCKGVILASISPIHTFSFDDLVEDYNKHMPRALSVLISRDMQNIKVSLISLDVPYITMAGEYEKSPADIIVPETNHRITNRYIERFVLVINDHELKRRELRSCH